MVDGPTMRQRVAELCRSLARRTGDGRFSAAAALLLGKRAGRRRLDDSEALRYAESLLRTGVAHSPHDAATRAAAMFAPSHQVSSVRDRLRKKMLGRN